MRACLVMEDRGPDIACRVADLASPRLLAAWRYSADAPGAEAQSPVRRRRPLQPHRRRRLRTAGRARRGGRHCPCRGRGALVDERKRGRAARARGGAASATKTSPFSANSQSDRNASFPHARPDRRVVEICSTYRAERQWPGRRTPPPVQLDPESDHARRARSDPPRRHRLRRSADGGKSTGRRRVERSPPMSRTHLEEWRGAGQHLAGSTPTPTIRRALRYPCSQRRRLRRSGACSISACSSAARLRIRRSCVTRTQPD